MPKGSPLNYNKGDGNNLSTLSNEDHSMFSVRSRGEAGTVSN